METTFIYCICASGGRVKVGHSRNPEARRRELQIGHPDPLEIAWTIPTSTASVLRAERLAHKALSQHRLVGEWFQTDSNTARLAVVEAVNCAQQHGENPRKLKPVQIKEPPLNMTYPTELKFGGDEHSFFLPVGWSNHPVFHDTTKTPLSKFAALMWILDHATPDGSTYTLTTSVKTLAKHLYWDKSRVRRFLAKLPEAENFGAEITLHDGLVTIVIHWMYEHMHGEEVTGGAI